MVLSSVQRATAPLPAAWWVSALSSSARSFHRPPLFSPRLYLRRRCRSFGFTLGLDLGDVSFGLRLLLRRHLARGVAVEINAARTSDEALTVQQARTIPAQAQAALGRFSSGQRALMSL